MKKILLLLPLFALVVLAGCAEKDDYPQVTDDTTGVVISGSVSAKLSPLTGTTSSNYADIVAQHSGADSCYTIISGAVYDMTSRIGKHPGGDKAILASCGKDSTEMFDGKHGMDPKKWEGLKQFEIKM